MSILKFLQSVAYKKELRSQLRLFIPFLLGQLCATGMGTVDTVMAGLAGTTEISGVAIGCSFYWPAYLFLAGMACAVTPTVSHILPSKNFSLMEKSLFNAFLFCTVVGMLVAVLLALSHLIFAYVPSNEKMIEVATGYLYFVSLSLPATVIYNVLRSYAEGLGYTKPTMYFGILMLVLDIPLNYIFIFGKFGIPQMGGVGCGATSCFINILCAILLYVYIKKGKFFKSFKPKEHLSSRFDYKLLKQFAKLSLPIGISRTIEVACFSVAAVILSPFGPTVVAAHSITLNVSGLIFMIPMCLGMTITIRSAFCMGTKNWAKAYISIKTALTLNLSLFIIYATLVFIFRKNISSLYTNDPLVLAMASNLMILNCIYMLPDSLQCFFLGVLQGFKDSKVIFIGTIVSYWVVGIPVGFALAWGLFTDKLEAYGIWIGFIFALISACLIYSTRVRHLFKHKKFPKLLAQSYM